MHAIFDTSTGALVSLGTVVADPLPAGLTAVELTPAQTADLQSGKGTWDPATHSVIPTPGWVDPAVAEGNKSAIQTNLTADLAALQVILDTSNATINANPAAHIKTMARNAKRLTRVALDDFTAAD